MVFGNAVWNLDDVERKTSNSLKLKFIEGKQRHYYYLIPKTENERIFFSDIFDERTGYNEQRKKLFVKTVNKKCGKSKAKTN